MEAYLQSKAEWEAKAKQKGPNKKRKAPGKIDWAEKRENKRLKRQDAEKWKEHDREDYDLTPVLDLNSPKFNEYYSKQFATIMSQEEFQSQFVKTLQDKLPVTFRINSGEVGFQKVCKMLREPDFIESYCKRVEAGQAECEERESDEEEKEAFNMAQQNHGTESLRHAQIDFAKLKMDCKEFYPNNVLFEMMIPKELLKKNLGLKGIHHLIMELGDCGLLTRQEIVSMLPPLLLDVQSHHLIFDMCAAPGSKTAQLLELIQSHHSNTLGRLNSEIPRGIVVANDADPKRAFMLTHQMNRLNTANIVITNHFAQFFPELKYVDCKKGEDVRVRYDRIVCDVPCSSDAAIRKIPQKWAKWSTKDGQSLHPLQLQILKRGIEVLKVGGKISYSTCSLNPIENEAVVAAALKEYAGKIRLLNVALPGFRFQEGFTNWRFLTQKPRGQEVAENESHFEEYSNYSEVPNDYHSHVKETMFETYYPESIRTQLTACLRVMPHHQNTSGFFITIIEKIAELEGDARILATEDSTFQIPSVIQQDKPDFKFFRCDPKDPDTEYIMAYYGFDKQFQPQQLITNSQAEMKKVSYISSELQRLLLADTKHQLNIISTGCEVFARNQAKNSNNVECIYRIVQDGLRFLMPSMHKRVLQTKDFLSFKRLISGRYHETAQIEDKTLGQAIEDLTVGCFVVVYVLPDGNVESITMHRFVRNISTMISKENLINLHMRYLTVDERMAARKTLYLEMHK